jgi:aconitate hydratase
VIGVRLRGALPAGSSATDLALTVTKALRDIGVSGEFVEFFGSGVATLTAGERSVVANMAPEYGATTGFFPVDAQTLAYLRATGRSEDAIAQVEALHRRAGLWFDPDNTPRYTRVLEIDLSTVHLHVARVVCRRSEPATERDIARVSRCHCGHHKLHQHIGPRATDRGGAGRTPCT